MKDSSNNTNKFIKDIKEFVIKNNRYIIVAVLFVVLIFLLVKCTSDEKSRTEKPDKQSEEQAQNKDEIITIEEGAEGEEAGQEAPPEVANDLLTDAYPEVNALVNSYYAAMASSDIEALKQIVNSLDEEEQNKIVQKREYIEGYNNIVCYSKIGPVENSYIIFAYYDIKFINIDTMAPGLELLYIYTDDSGKMYIYNGELDPETDAYVSTISGEEDVVNLFNTVNTKYQEVQAADPDLKAFVEQLNSVASTPQQENTPEEAPATEESAPEESAPEQ